MRKEHWIDAQVLLAGWPDKAAGICTYRLLFPAEEHRRPVKDAIANDRCTIASGSPNRDFGLRGHRDMQ